MLSSTVNSLRILYSWNTNPTSVLRQLSKSVGVKSLLLLPLMIISPESALSSPPQMFKSVDFPLPDLPSRNTMPVSGKETETSSSAFVSAPFFGR